jgi:hypothetical protein
VFDDRNGEMGFIVDEAGYIVFGHFGKLFLEDTFQASEDYVAFAGIVVVHHSELDYAILLFKHRWLFGEGDDVWRG